MMHAIEPEGWPKASGFSNGIVAKGRIICVAGQIGWDAATQKFTTDSFAEQVRYALRNTVAVLQAGGARADHIVRMTWFVTDKREYQSQLKEVGRAYREEIGRVFPAMALFESRSARRPGQDRNRNHGGRA